MYVGIDNGISGAVTVLDNAGAIVAWAPMPVQRARKGNEVDVMALTKWLNRLHHPVDESTIYTIEEPGGSKSARAASGMAGSFHAVRAVLTLRGARWDRVTPRAWQKVMLPGCGKGETKARALEAARRLWPDEKWLRTDKCTTPHDGAIDAALIAEWARRVWGRV